MTGIGFVLGTGRCGSTLAHEVLCRHTGVDFFSNLEDLSPIFRRLNQWNGALLRALPPTASQKGRLRFAPSEGYRALDRASLQMLTDPYRDLQANDLTPWMRQRLYEVILGNREREPDKVFLHKFTGWPRAMLLNQVFPEAKFVHVVRDGRAVANSWLQMPWWQGHRGATGWQFGSVPTSMHEEWVAAGESLPALAGIAWKLLMKAHDDAKFQFGNIRWLDVRYEDMVAQPETVIGQILDFFDMPGTDSFARQIARYEFSAGKVDAFRRDLGDEHTAMLTRLLEPELAAWHYLD